MEKSRVESRDNGRNSVHLFKVLLNAISYWDKDAGLSLSVFFSFFRVGFLFPSSPILGMGALGKMGRSAVGRDPVSTTTGRGASIVVNSDQNNNWIKIQLKKSSIGLFICHSLSTFLLLFPVFPRPKLCTSIKTLKNSSKPKKHLEKSI